MFVHIDENTEWKNLPWAKIRQRVFILQQKIFIASKMCNKITLSKAQNDLINSSEAKAIAIQKICQSTILHYFSWSQDRYRIRGIDKLFILKSLFYKYSYAYKSLYSKLGFLFQQVNQYLIYLCTEPEWRIRFEPVFLSNTFNLNSDMQTLFSQKVTPGLAQCKSAGCFTPYAYIDMCIMSKHINIGYLKQKMQASLYSRSSILNWLRLQSLQEILSSSQLISLSDACSQTFIQLFYRILLNGIQWFNLLIRSKKVKSCTFVKSSKKTIYPMLIDDKFSSDKLRFFLFNKKKYKKLLFTLRVFYQAIRIFPDVFIYINLTDSGAEVRPFNFVKKVQLSFFENIYKEFSFACKTLLYNKDSFNRLRSKHSLKISLYLVKILNKVRILYKLCYAFLSLRTIIKIYEITDTVLFFYQKNKFKSLASSSAQYSYQTFIEYLINTKKYLLYISCVNEVNR
uniref:Reverse transcriptase N-terminal domain-containing protein n=1 Tax=Melanthalia intermedia TaxID=172989 RepID=A0A345UAN2_9FLOR|nr:hypothetical protein [Melanthalia intermedia]AXI97518.1 hypothetical protein [Melanthalia intermedia]